MITIHSIVEGHGDAEAVPIVLKRIAASLVPRPEFKLGEAIRTKKSKLIKSEDGELERIIKLLAGKTTGKAIIVCIIDSDKMCPKIDSVPLLKRMESTRPDIPKSLVLAHRTFEAWYVAAAESLRGKCGLKEDFQTIDNLELGRGHKEYISDAKINGCYNPVIDQPAFAKVFDLQQARRASSFDKLFRDMIRIFSQLNRE